MQQASMPLSNVESSNETQLRFRAILTYMFSSGYRLGVSAYPPGPREVLKEVVAWLLPRYYLHRAYRDVILRTGGLA